jgi:hypothetical protein
MDEAKADFLVLADNNEQVTEIAGRKSLAACLLAAAA